MPTNQRIAVVTGANRGLGWEIVRQLAAKNIMVVLAARNREKGMMAASEFQREDNLPVRFHHLDVASPSSIDALGQFLEKEYGRVDILINNAGIFPDVTNHDVGDPEGALHTPLENVRKAMETNVYGPLLLCQRLIPIMQRNNYGRIVNMSSGLGQLSEYEGEGRFLAYRMSKTALNMVTRTLAAELKGSNILVNSCCPGWCRTDMGGPYAERSPSEGADTPVWLATLPDDSATGGFFRNRKPISW